MALDYSAIITRDVVVKPKTLSHQYFGTGSLLGYYLDNIESPLLGLAPGKTYRFTQEDPSNRTHQLLFYTDAGRANQYTTNVTTVGTAGSIGAYTEIVVTDATPVTLYYQCINHPYMGNAIQLGSDVIGWQPSWSELDLVFGLANDSAGNQILLDPANFATLPRANVQLADVSVLGSEAGERIFAGIGSLIDAAGGNDELFNTDSQGDNVLVGGTGADRFFLRPINDRIIGGQLFSSATDFGLPSFTALVDKERDSFLIDSSNPGSTDSLQILDYEPGIDELLIDGVAPSGEWAAVRQQLQVLNVAINAAPQLINGPVVISLRSGVEISKNLSPFGLDLDGDSLQLLKLEGPSWISTSGTVLTATVPTSLTASQLASTTLLLGFSDGKAVSSFTAQLTLNETSGINSNDYIVSITLPNGEAIEARVTISNADLVGSTLKIVPISLIEPGVTTNQSGLDFQLTVDRGASAFLNAPIELVASDLLPQLTDPTGARRTDRKLLYYAINQIGAVSPLTYDPITGAGARFYDLDNNGIADFFSLSLIDGGYGDKDGLANGVIDDPSVAGFADLTNLRFSSAGSGSVTIGDPINAAPAAVSLRATLSDRPASSNQIGYVVLNPSEVDNSDALLTDLTWLRGRSQNLLSSLENTDVTLPAGISFDRDIQLINGQSIRFFEVVDASLEQLTSLSDGRFRLLNHGDINNSQVGFSSPSGVRFSLNILPNDPGLNALISQAQGLAPVLDLSAFTTTQSLSGTVAIGREADFNSVAGFYRTLDALGTVLAADAITRLRPGDNGYAAAALSTDNLIGQLGDLSVADNQSTSRSFSGITGGTFLAPFAQVNGNTFFAFAGANTDGISHFRSLGNNLFGLEDIVGGGDKDYDDLVIGFNFSGVV